MKTYCFNKPIDIDSDECKNKKNDYKEYLKAHINGENAKLKDPYNDPDVVWKKNNLDYYSDLKNLLLDNNKFGNSICEMENGRIVLKYTIDNKKDITLYTDVFGFSNPSTLNDKHPYYKYLKLGSNNIDKKLECVTSTIVNTRTIGGGLIFPEVLWDYYNKNRGVNKYIEDRIDLTLNEIKQCIEYLHLGNDEQQAYFDKHNYNILLKRYVNLKYKKMELSNKEKEFVDIFEKWFKQFENFNDYVEIFKFNDFIVEDKIIDIYNSDLKNNSVKFLPVDNDYIEKIVGRKKCIKVIQNTTDEKDLKRLFSNIETLIMSRSERISVISKK